MALDKEKSDAYIEAMAIAQVLINKLDLLQGSTEQKHLLKKATNDFLRESKKEVNKLYKKFEAIDIIPADGLEHRGIDIYQALINAYDNVIGEHSHVEMLAISEFINQAKSKGLDFKTIEVYYKPLDDE